MNTYTIRYSNRESGVEGTECLTAASTDEAVGKFRSGPNIDGQNMRIVGMRLDRSDGVTVNRDILCYPYELGGGPVDMTPDRVPVCEDCGRTWCEAHR